MALSNPSFWNNLQDAAYTYTTWSAVTQEEKANLYSVFGRDFKFHDAQSWAGDVFAGEGCSLEKLNEFHRALLKFMSSGFSNLSTDYDPDSKEKVEVPESFLADAEQLRDLIFDLCDGMMGEFIDERFFDDARLETRTPFYGCNFFEEPDFELRYG